VTGIPTPETELIAVKLMKASEMVQGAPGALFKSHGLSAPQYNVLRILRGAKAAGLNCHDISARMIKRVPDITRLLDRLEAKKLVTRRRSDADRRVVMAYLTEPGARLLGLIDVPLSECIHHRLDALDKNDLGQLNTLLDRLLAQMEE
jgi:DNA-binding MarR family transcriptional regulator